MSIFKIHHHPGEIKYLDKYYLDQLSEKETWIFCTQFPRYLKSTYDLSIEQYYNLCHGYDLNHTERCKHCNTPVGLYRLYHGYLEFCSQSCITSFRLLKESEEGRNPFQQGSFIKENSERIRNSQLERFSSGSHHFQTDENELKAKRGYFISQYGDLETYLYIAILEDSKDYKIGISTDPYYRVWYQDQRILTKHNIKKGTGKSMAELEYQIKLKFCSGRSEVLNKPVREVLQFIKDYQ